MLEKQSESIVADGKEAIEMDVPREVFEDGNECERHQEVMRNNIKVPVKLINTKMEWVAPRKTAQMFKENGGSNNIVTI